MSGRIARQQVRVPFREGLHYRPASAFVKTAKQFDSSVRVHKADMFVDGKSIVELVTLVAVEGDVLTLEAEGEDAQQAVEALAELLRTDWEHDPAEFPTH